MRRKTWNSKLVAGLAVAIGLAVLVTSRGTAQEPSEDVLIVHGQPDLGGEPQVKPLDVIKLKTDAKLTVDGMQKKIIAIRGGQPGQMHAIREAVQVLNQAEGEDARDEAKEKLTKLLDEYFEADMERREQELADVEERVKKLRTTLERRREKKRDILDLQMEVLLNEADGLGFFGGDMFGAPGNPYQLNIQAYPGTAPALPMPPGPRSAPRGVIAPPSEYGYGRGGGGGGYGGYGRGGEAGGYGRGGYGRTGEEIEPREREERERQEGGERRR